MYRTCFYANLMQIRRFSTDGGQGSNRSGSKDNRRAYNIVYEES